MIFEFSTIADYIECLKQLRGFLGRFVAAKIPTERTLIFFFFEKSEYYSVPLAGKMIFHLYL